MLRRQLGIRACADRVEGSTRASLGTLAVFGLCLLLGACQVPQNHPGAAQTSAAPEISTQAPATQAAKPKPAVPLAATPAVAHDTLNLAPASRLTGDPKELLGLDHKQVRRALGDPNRIRTEDPAQVWQYVTGDCVVDLYLYDRSGGLRVTYVEARSHPAEQAPTGRCLKLLLERPTAQNG